jgi:hypothetical protein
MSKERTKISIGIKIRSIDNRRACVLAHPVVIAIVTWWVDVMLVGIEVAKRRLREILPVLRKEFKVKSVGIFGSYVRGDICGFQPHYDVNVDGGPHTSLGGNRHSSYERIFDSQFLH